MDWKLSEEQGQILIEIDRTLQEQIRLEVDKEIKSCGFYNVENSTGNAMIHMENKLRYDHHQKETKSASMTSSDFALQRGNKKRLRCNKVQNINNNYNDSIDSVVIPKISIRVDRQVVRSDLKNQPATTNTISSNAYLNLRQPATSSSHRIL
ncbi:hypothetical protein H5410_040185, partial [Solanum commersonii]